MVKPSLLGCAVGCLQLVVLGLLLCGAVDQTAHAQDTCLTCKNPPGADHPTTHPFKGKCACKVKIVGQKIVLTNFEKQEFTDSVSITTPEVENQLLWSHKMGGMYKVSYTATNSKRGFSNTFSQRLVVTAVIERSQRIFGGPHCTGSDSIIKASAATTWNSTEHLKALAADAELQFALQKFKGQKLLPGWEVDRESIKVEPAFASRFAGVRFETRYILACGDPQTKSFDSSTATRSQTIFPDKDGSGTAGFPAK